MFSQRKFASSPAKCYTHPEWSSPLPEVSFVTVNDLFLKVRSDTVPLGRTHRSDGTSKIRVPTLQFRTGPEVGRSVGWLKPERAGMLGFSVNLI